jgi:hypothetical protein
MPLILRAVKGSKLTIPEMDGNLLWLAGNISGSGVIPVTGSSIDASNTSITSSFFVGDGSQLTNVTASFVTASNVFGPYGSNSVISASFAVSASYVLSASYALSSSFATTASYTPNAGALTNSLSQGPGITPFSYNGVTSQNVSVSGAANLISELIIKWNGNAFVTSSLTDDGVKIIGNSSIQLSGANSSLTGSFIGQFAGNLVGTSSWASQAISSSYVNGNIFTSANPALSASYALSSSFTLSSSFATSASNAITASYVPNMKAGSASIADFSGDPFIATITTSFPNNNYSVTVTGTDPRSWTIQSKTLNGFTINSNSAVTLTGPVYWIAIPFNN